MSHKSVKRSKKHVEDEVSNAEFKAPDSTKTKEEGTKNLKNDSDVIIIEDTTNVLKKSPSKDENPNVDSSTSENGDSSLPKRSMQTRSSSNNTIKKTNESTNGIKDEELKKDEDAEVSEAKEVKPDDKPEELKESVAISPSNSVEMDALILDKDDEEAIPELEFDENDVEVESEGSNSRCKTRRSQSRNISTPKTPKTLEIEEFEIVDQFHSRGGSITPKPVTSSSESQNTIILCEIDLNDTSDTQSSVSTSNISTKAVAGSDATRYIDLTGQDSGLFEDNSFSNSSNKSFADTLKCLSGRRAIRSLGTTPNRTDYRKHVLKKNSVENKGDLYADYECVERISVGMKRKSRSFSPGEPKRVKMESGGMFSFIPNPFSNLRNSFKRSNTPKLLTMERNCAFDDAEKLDKIKLESGAENEKKFCNVM